MNRNLKILLALFLCIISGCFFNNLFCQGKSIKRIEIDENQAKTLYNKGKYKEACQIYIATTNKRKNVQRDKIEQAIFIFFLIDALGLFLFLYLEKRRAYKKLVSKNMECAKRPMLIIKDLDLDNINFSDIKDKQILIALQDAFEKDKVFLNKDITINDLSKQLNTNKNNLSKLINTYLNKTFPTLLNEYRINEAIKLLVDKKTCNYKMEAISEMCGYNNRQVFHCAFKKETGITPNDFRKMSQ
ncbi:MAG: helix-turn-helix transcriptional regulator [Bacteroidales bacterium]|jgi:YesN/AraC family two-component response regulator|nr:helix-turn-helix transcriptional regulator [Bacteroidales bacterium]